MSEYTPRDYVIFRRMSPHLIPGFSFRMIASFGAGLFIGFAIFFGLGLFTCEVTRPASYADRAAQAEELTESFYALSYLEGKNANENDPEGLSIVEAMRERYLPGRSDEEIELLTKKARNAGIPSETKQSEISAFIPGEVTEKECAIPIFLRVLISALPAAIGAVLFIEVNGASVAGELIQRLRNKQALTTYVFRRKR